MPTAFRIIGVAAIYGAELGLGTTELILALLLVQFVGIPFSLIFGRLPNPVPVLREDKTYGLRPYQLRLAVLHVLLELVVDEAEPPVLNNVDTDGGVVSQGAEELLFAFWLSIVPGRTYHPARISFLVIHEMHGCLSQDSTAIVPDEFHFQRPRPRHIPWMTVGKLLYLKKDPLTH